MTRNLNGVCLCYEHLDICYINHIFYRLIISVSTGREFYFKVNGIQMYSKGSNSIPIHVLPEKVTKEKTKWLLQSAKHLNTNMIRVWGGGLYESDLFYDVRLL